MRTVRLAPSAEEALEACEQRFPRFDEVYWALEWLLSNDPGSQGVARGKFRICRQFSQWASLPGIVAVYSFDDDIVEIHGIMADETVSENSI